MAPVTRQLQLLPMILAGWINRQQLELIEYILEENRLLKERLDSRRIRFTDAERRRIARKAHLVGRKVLFGLDTLVTPDTLLRWYRTWSRGSGTTVRGAIPVARLRLVARWGEERSPTPYEAGY